MSRRTQRSPQDVGRAGAVGGSALIFVRNPCTHDARVLREARTLVQLGFAPTIVAVVSEGVRERRSMAQGIPIVRLEPGSPASWLRAALRRLRGGARAGSDGGVVVTSAPGTVTGRRGRLGSAAVRLHRWLRTLDYYRRGVGMVRSMRPCLVHCNDYNTMWIGVSARLLGATVVYDAHELWPDRNLRPEPRWWLLACELLFVRVASATITASPGYAKVMARRYRIPVPEVIRNVPAAPPPQDRGRAPVGGGGGMLAVYAGALTRNRGLEVSIEALAQVPELRLRLIGPIDPRYRGELERLAIAHGVRERLEFAAPVPPERLIDSIRRADLGLALIQPTCLSYRLSLPNKLFEYVAAGLPVLGSDLPVIGGFIADHEIGLVARAGAPADVADRMRALLEPERNRAARLAVARVAREIRWEHESRRLADTYKAAVEAHPVR
jgi:glycosyltransferase involved in cell wall biosynthesis